jgi:hypothetical protein
VLCSGRRGGEIYDAIAVRLRRAAVIYGDMHARGNRWNMLMGKGVATGSLIVGSNFDGWFFQGLIGIEGVVVVARRLYVLTERISSLEMERRGMQGMMVMSMGEFAMDVGVTDSHWRTGSLIRNRVIPPEWVLIPMVHGE